MPASAIITEPVSDRRPAGERLHLPHDPAITLALQQEAKAHPQSPTFPD